MAAVIVTSAAIACGLEALGIVERPHDMPSLQAAASVGQARFRPPMRRRSPVTAC